MALLTHPVFVDQFVDNWAAEVWTGTGFDGRRTIGNTLGTATVVYGFDEVHLVRPGCRMGGMTRYYFRSLYALSQELTVPPHVEGQVPEPLSTVVWLGLASVVGLATCVRRRTKTTNMCCHLAGFGSLAFFAACPRADASIQEQE